MYAINVSYKSSPLADTVNDANDMAGILKKCNFKVMKFFNVNRREKKGYA